MRFRFLFEGIAILVSILLAFAIQAWWDNRQEELVARELLEALANELDENISMAESRLRFRSGKMESARSILAMAAGSVPKNRTELDALIADVTYYGITNFSTGAVKSIIDSAALSHIEEVELRSRIASWPDEVVDLNVIEAHDYDTLKNLLYPYLVEHSAYVQISNAARGRPGDREFMPVMDKLPGTDLVDHNYLLDDEEFLSLVAIVSNDQDPLISMYPPFIEKAKAIRQMVTEVLAR